MGVGINVLGCTSNATKSREFKKQLSKYGVGYFVSTVDVWNNMKLLLEQLNKLKEDTNCSRVYAIREETKLLDESHRIMTDINDSDHLNTVTHQSIMMVSFINTTGEFITLNYNKTIDGYIDINRKNSEPSIFGWDDVFVTNANNMSYYEMIMLGYEKISARDKCMSQFLDEYIVYPTVKGFGNITDILPYRPIDFREELSVGKHIEKLGAYFLNDVMIKSKFVNIFHGIVDSGTFLRFYKNRSQKVYWAPGLNSGLPAIQKSTDFFHELTYHVHDICHGLAPDLIVTNSNSPLHRLVYVGARLMSECITLVLADMIFVHLLEKSGYNYESKEKRKIYQVFQEMKIDLLEISDEERVETIKNLLYGSFRYCFFGDDSKWKQMIESVGGDVSVLKSYKDKYTNFFMADFNWSNRNWENMTQNKKTRYSFEKWADTLVAFNCEEIDLYTTDQVIDMLKLTDMEKNEYVLEVVYEWFVNSYYLPKFKADVVISESKTFSPQQIAKSQMTSFRRWIYGQVNIMFNNDDIRYERTLKTIMMTLNMMESNVNKGNPFDIDMANKVRQLYEKHLERLLKVNRITKNDYISYSDIYPIFPPVYLTDYDSASVQETYSKMIELDDTVEITTGECMNKLVKSILD
jgi:hypothetical protein